MKSKLESVRKGSRTIAPAQSKTEAPQAKPRPERLARRTITAVVLRPDSSEWCRVDFSRGDSARIERAASKLGITLERLFEDAMDHLRSTLNSRRAA